MYLTVKQLKVLSAVLHARKTDNLSPVLQCLWLDPKEHTVTATDGCILIKVRLADNASFSLGELSDEPVLIHRDDIKAALTGAPSKGFVIFRRNNVSIYGDSGYISSQPYTKQEGAPLTCDRILAPFSRSVDPELKYGLIASKYMKIAEAFAEAFDRFLGDQRRVFADEVGALHAEIDGGSYCAQIKIMPKSSIF